MEKGMFSDDELRAMSPKEFRNIVRQGDFAGSTGICCQGYNQANLVIIPKDLAFDFLLFCQRNPRPCYVLDVTEAGDPHPKLMAPEADLRTDLPRYRVYKDGKLVDEPNDICNYWRDDLVGFLLGCSFGFDWSLRAANVTFRYIGAYTSNIECIPAGRFHSHMVVSARLVKGRRNAIRAVQISSRLPASHGEPVHIGDPSVIGIKDLYHADIWAPGAIAPQEPDETVMFWGCGITPQTAAMESNVPFMITHWPGHMFVTDKLTEEMAIL